MPIDVDAGKSLLTSKTFWGVIISVAAVFSNKLGLKLSDNVQDIIVVLGSLFAIVGRVTATKQITGIIVPDKTDVPLQK